MGIYDNDGKIKLTSAPGTGFCGLYAPDGSWYFTLEPGSGFCGSTAPNGSLYVHNATGEGFGGRYAANGAIRVTSANEYNGAIRVSGLSSLAVSIDFLSTTAIPSWMTFTATGLATQFDSTGKLTYRPNNLLTQSNTFSNPAWVKLTGGTATAAVVTANAGTDPLGGNNASRLQADRGAGGTSSDYSLLYQGITPGAQIKTLRSIWVKSNNGSSQSFVIYDGAGRNVGVTNTATTSWQQFALPDGAGTNAISELTIGTRGGSGQYYTGGQQTLDLLIYSAVIAAVTYETSPRPGDQVITTSAAYYGPRIDYDPNTLAVKGLLIEEARTNLAINSASLSSFSPFNVTATTNFAVAPDGTNAATKLDDGVVAAIQHQIALSPSGLSASTAYTFSVFAKQGTGRYLALSNVGSSSADGGYAVFDLQAGTVTQSAALGVGSLISATITPINGGWYRLSVTSVATTNTSRFLFVLGSDSGTYTADSNGRKSYTGTNNTWLVWGAQFEPGSFATSYTPTAASAVTRAAETVQLTGPAASALQAAQGSVVVQVTDQSIGYGATGGVVLGGSSTYWLDLASGNMYSNSASHFLNTANAAVAGSPYRAGVAWNASGRSLAMNGGTVVSDAFGGWAGTTPYLGSLSGTANFANAHFASLAIYTSHLPDATLQSQSVVGATYV